MAVEQTQKYCTKCQNQELHCRPGTNHILHLLITVLLCGFWIPIWILSSLRIGGWRCQRCGTLPNQAAQSILALVLVVFGGVFAYSKCSSYMGGDNDTKQANAPPPSSDDWATVNGNSRPRTAPPRTFYDKKPIKTSPQTTIETAPEPSPDIVQPAPPVPAVSRYLKTLEGIPLPVTLAVDETIRLLDATGHEVTIEAGKKILVTNRSAGGTLTMTIDRKSFVGNESRLSDNVRIDGK